jgi:hypothetical protein
MLGGAAWTGPSPEHGEPDIICYHLPESCQKDTLCVPLIAQGEAIGLLSFQNINEETASFAAIWS